MKSGAGGIHPRPALPRRATTPIATVMRSAAVHRPPLARRTTGVTASDAAKALAISAPYGGADQRSATLSAANTEMTKKR